MLSVQGLRVDRGGIQILDIPEFNLYGNEFVTLIGPNGCGKSTLLLSMMCLLKRVTGRIVFKGQEIDTDKQALDYRRRIAMVLQDPLLYDTTIYDNIASGLRIRGMARSEIKTRVMSYLERFNLSHMAHRHARKLSGGEARRVSLARAFAVEPDMIFFDEPFANLDPPTRQTLSMDMVKIIRETGISSILVTHDQSEALRLSDRIVVMNRGRIVQAGTSAEVMNNPANEFVANFVGMETILEGVVKQNLDGQMIISVAGTEINVIGELRRGEEVYCGIRPENVVIETVNPAETTSARNVFPAKITEISSLGPFLRVSLECGFPLVSFLTREAFATLELETGKDVFASFKATAVHLIQKK
ncbi:MAG TPA: ABC transporter ATP-binding protein [Geobacteraceae bacterium]|nr:ABC transporter ATP-binding protein [Geobacteraceae bacterium]